MSEEKAKEFTMYVEKGVEQLGIVAEQKEGELDAIDLMSQEVLRMTIMVLTAQGEIKPEEIADKIKEMAKVLFEAHPRLYVYIRYLIAYCVGYGVINSD